MIKFIHLADMHLGLEIKNPLFNEVISSERRQSLWSTFKNIIDRAIEDEVDFIFIAGDLFEEDYFTIGDMTRVRDILARARDVKILIAAGNHDYIHKDSVYNKVNFSENVHIFDNKGMEKVEYEDLDTAVFGYSWDFIEKKENNLFKNLDLQTDCKNKVMVLHGDLISKSNYLPLDLDKLKSLNMDYIALGHIHKGEIFENNIAYPGCPEPTHFGEEGDKGYIYGEIGNGLKLSKEKINKKSFKIINIEINETMSYLNIIEDFLKIKDRDKNFYRVILEGYIDNNINKKQLFKDIKDEFYYIEIKDRTIPNFDLLSLERDYKDGIVGEFIREIKEHNVEDPIVKDALYIGLEALLKDR